MTRTFRRRRYVAPFAGVLLAASLIIGCGLGSKLDESNAALNRAVSTIDDGIGELSRNSANWQNIVRDVQGKLSKDVSDTINADVSNLVQRSTANFGVEFRANTDFLAARATHGLEVIKAKLLGKPIPPTEPVFAEMIPTSLDLNIGADHRTKAELCGWDFDQKDDKGALFTVVMIGPDNKQFPFPEDRVGRTTHYSAVVNVAGDDFEKDLSTKRISKIAIMWGGKRMEGSGELLVIPKTATPPQERSEQVKIGTLSYQPPHVAQPGHSRGDPDFNVHDDRPMQITVRGEVRLAPDGSRLQKRAYMSATEPRPDWTAAIGQSAWQDAYVPPPDWRIARVTVPKATSQTISNAKSSEQPVPIDTGNGSAVARFEVWGDHGGNDAGVFSRVLVHFNPVDVVLVKTK